MGLHVPACILRKVKGILGGTETLRGMRLAVGLATGATPQATVEIGSGRHAGPTPLHEYLDMQVRHLLEIVMLTPTREAVLRRAGVALPDSREGRREEQTACGAERRRAATPSAL